MIIVFNKIDAFSFVPKEEDDLTPRTRENVSLDELKNTWMNRLQDNCIFISAKDKINVDELKTKFTPRVSRIMISCTNNMMMLTMEVWMNKIMLS